MAIQFALFIGVCSVGLGYAVNGVFDGVSITSEPEHTHGGLGPTVEKISTGILFALILFGVLRKGLRGFFLKVIQPH